MSKIEINAKYAPGISTYGAVGARGKQGYNGYSIYFIPYNIDNLDNNTQEFNLIQNDIINNRFISLNKNGNKDVLNRPYQINDLFILPNSKIFRLNGLNYEYGTVSFQEIGKLNETVPFEANNGYIYNSDNNSKKLLLGLFDADDLPTDISNVPLTIFPNNGKYLTLGNDNNLLSIVKDPSNNFFNIVSNNPIIFDASVIYTNNSQNDYIEDNYGDKYFKVENYKFPDKIDINDTINFKDNKIYVKDIITGEIPENTTFDLNILYFNNGEYFEQYIMNISTTEVYNIKNDYEIKSISLIVNYNNNYISKSYNLKF